MDFLKGNTSEFDSKQFFGNFAEIEVIKTYKMHFPVFQKIVLWINQMFY